MVTPDGFLCLPLLFDPEVARDLGHLPPSAGTAKSPVPFRSDDCEYIPVLRLTSFAASYEQVWPREYEALRQAVCQELGLPKVDDPGLEGWLARLVFDVLPHFVRLGPGLRRGSSDPEAVLTFLGQRLSVPREYQERARQGMRPEELRRGLRILEARAVAAPSLPWGRVSGADLDRWLRETLRARILEEERRRWARRLDQSRQPEDRLQARTALLLYLRDRGGLEIDGFGFFPDPRSPGDYWVYRRTGEYLLQDYYGRLYLFPDCRVAVSTRERLRPVVWETYKHPFLRRHAPRQEICLPREYQVPVTVGPREIIAALEAGLNALYHGYNPRRRNGYHSLDRHRGEQLVSFDDYRLAPEDPRLLSGRWEVKNRYL